MLLAVDIGNTNVVFGLYDGDTLAHTFRAATVHTRTEDEYAVLLLQLLSLHGLSPKAVDAAIVASVVPPLTDVMADSIRRAFAREPVLVGPGLKTGIPVLYENPREVGADRIVNAVAAFERVHGPVIVVDFGTATTFDCISPKGEYLGGVIVPGVRVSLDALLEHAAKLSRIELAAPPRVLGRNTTHALQSGLIIGHAIGPATFRDGSRDFGLQPSLDSDRIMVGPFVSLRPSPCRDEDHHLAHTFGKDITKP